MQDITKEIKNTIRQEMLSLLETLSPIKSSAFKIQLLEKLGYTRDQFGFAPSGGSKIEKFISDEFWKLKQEGKVEQDANTWIFVKQNPEFQNPEFQNPMVQNMTTYIEEEQEEEETQNPVVNIAELVNPALTNKLLACDGYRNSLIENTACFGMFDKTQCHGCMLAFWCSPFTGEKKAEKKAERQAKKQVKTAKEVLLEKYADKKETLENLLSLINHAVKIPNNSHNQIKCFFDAQTIINPQEDCMFVRNFGVICMKVFNEFKDAGLVK
jgi:hypothetical protein